MNHKALPRTIRLLIAIPVSRLIRVLGCLLVGLGALHIEPAMAGNVQVNRPAAPTPPVKAAGPLPMELRAGQTTLRLFPLAPGHYGLQLQWQTSDPLPQAPAGATFRQDAPLAIEVVDSHGTAVWLTGTYTSATRAGDIITCRGSLTSANGTEFQFSDSYHRPGAAGTFELTRKVTVFTPNPADVGFSSRFSLPCSDPLTTRDCDILVPGIWYGDNSHVPPTALGSHPNDRYLYFREDRLPLPTALLRERRTGVTLALSHVGGEPATFAGDDGLNRIIDGRMQFGALGFINTGRLAPTFIFPGTEGERTYISGPSAQGNRWAYRSHPVQAGFTQSYQLVIRADHTPDFPAAVRQEWLAASALARTPIVKGDIARVYQAGMELLATYCHEYQGVISMPFAVRVPSGEVDDTSSEMGFVGAALPAAALLLKYGLETNNPSAVTHASALIDYWARNARTPAGTLRTWYDIHPDGSVTWRAYPMFLRVASDGLEGVLQAWAVMRANGQSRPEWLAFCRSYGDWLVKAQNPDGSYWRSYGADGQPVDRHTDTTDHPIRFLVDLAKATGEITYRTAALRAGEFCQRTVHQNYAYVGGTPDNPNVMDKEGGMMALDAFLALYDSTRDRRWLTQATQAAWYSATWIYLWNIPMPPDDPQVIFPKGRTTYGLSLIATGHSGADNYMAAAPFLYYRLFLLTGETYFRDIARLLQYDTTQMMDWDGTLNYTHPGLLTEALTLAPLRGHGVSNWLPWLTVASLEPLARLQETFGAMDIDAIERLPEAERRRRNAQYADRRGFPIPDPLKP